MIWSTMLNPSPLLAHGLRSSRNFSTRLMRLLTIHRKQKIYQMPNAHPVSSTSSPRLLNPLCSYFQLRLFLQNPSMTFSPDLEQTLNFLDLIDPAGFVQGFPIKDEPDLELYASRVAGTIAELCLGTRLSPQPNK